MWTKQQIIEKCKEQSNGIFTPVADISFSLTYPEKENLNKIYIQATVTNGSVNTFYLWDHQADNDWYLDSFYISKNNAQDQFDAYIRLVDFIGLTYKFALPTQEVIKETVVEKLVRDTEKEKNLEGQIAVYERLLGPFKNLTA